MKLPKISISVRLRRILGQKVVPMFLDHIALAAEKGLLFSDKGMLKSNPKENSETYQYRHAMSLGYHDCEVRATFIIEIVGEAPKEIREQRK